MFMLFNFLWAKILSSSDSSSEFENKSLNELIIWFTKTETYQTKYINVLLLPE